MKVKNFLLIIVFTTSTVAFSKNEGRKPTEWKSGSKCGLVDSWGDFSDVQTTFDISRSTRIVKSLPKVVQNQLIAAASFANGKVSDPIKAAQYLRENSEGEELYVLRAEHIGKKFSVISYYGGGNHTGSIFPWGSDKQVASIEDDDIVCR